MGKSGRRLARGAGKVLLGLAVGCAIAEGAFHLRDGGAFPHLNVYVADADLGVRLRAGATQKVAFGGNPTTSVRINAEGYRGADWGPPAPGEVMVLGDSQVFGLGVEEDQTFAAIAEQKMGGATKVRNAGVPTYGPVEMEKVLASELAARKPSVVVYAVNFVNDPFEAARPNTGRHRVWDGWAVRAETAPAVVTSFPGRAWLFGQSHAVFAIRQWLHGRRRLNVIRTPSEGAAQDLLDLDAALEVERARAADTTRATWERDEATRRAATLEAINADQRLKQIALTQQKLQGESAGVYLVAGASPGDIVIPQLGEEGSPLAATAEFVNQAAALRQKVEARLLEEAQAHPGTAAAKEALDALAHRDAAEARRRALDASPVQLLRATQPIVVRALAAKKLAEAAGARFVLLVLPMDVQVSPTEWEKYGESPIDMKPAEILVDDLASSLRDAGATVVVPTAALAAAEPGAFLDHDPHLSPRGHAVVGELLAEALTQPAASRPPAPPVLALPVGRSRVPDPEAWGRVGELQVHGSDARGCRTQKIREWMRVACTPSADRPAPRAITILAGGHGEAMSFVVDGLASLIVPVVPGDTFRARFSWPDHADDLAFTWGAAEAEVDRAFERTKAEPEPASPDAARALLTCLDQAKRAPASFIGGANADCQRTYAKDCAAMIACAEGSPLHAPTCPPGTVNAGAALWCLPEADVAASPEASAESSRSEGEVRPFDAAAFSQAATAFLDAQVAYGNTCHLSCEEPGNWFEFVCFDQCAVDPAQLGPAIEAFTPLAPFAETRAPRAALTFLGRARALHDFLRGVEKTRVARGTLELYQDTALAYRAFAPDAKVELMPPVPRDELFVKHPTRAVDYIWEQPRCVDDAWQRVECLGKVRRVTVYEIRAHRGLPLRWRTGAQGPFLAE